MIDYLVCMCLSLACDYPSQVVVVEGSHHVHLDEPARVLPHVLAALEFDVPAAVTARASKL